VLDCKIVYIILIIENNGDASTENRKSGVLPYFDKHLPKRHIVHLVSDVDWTGIELGVLGSGRPATRHLIE
jgi:hypothetical protein